METAPIGLLGVLIGILLNETLRRRNRIESYATKVFDKRLEIYEGLYKRVCVSGEIGTDVIQNSKYTSKQRLEIVSAAIHDIAGWCDSHEMYLNDELTVHCTPLLMGVEDIHDLEDSDGKEEQIKQFRENLQNAKKIIRKESGIDDIEKMFSSITKPKHISPIIDYYREKKRELGAKGKWE